MTSFLPSPEQQAIIAHPLEPLRVAAGAGAGKTGTMAVRLAEAVRTGGVEPDEVLGITFTNKAAAALAQRVRTVLPEAAVEGREVEVVTYHGFAHGLLREFGPLVGTDREPRIVTPGYARQLMRDAIGETSRPTLDLTRPGVVVDQVARLASLLGDHLLEPAAVSPGDGDVGAERAVLLDILGVYDRRKRDLGVVDYADLVTLAHRLVTEHPEVASRVRDRYRLVLLDEYQDTNPGQRMLLQRIFGDGFPVTAVGDTDQTIYEWRGASPHNFEAFPQHFRRRDGKSAATLELSVTWRNDRRIVEVANQVRSNIEHRSPLEALVPKDDAEQGEVVAHWAHSATDEARWIAEEVAALHEAGTPWREIGILFRRHRQIASVRDALVARDIPVEVASLGGLLEVPEVVDLHAWLRLLGRPDDAVAVTRVLTGSRYRLGLGDLGPLVRWVAGRQVEPDEEVEIGWALLEAVDELEGVQALTGEARRRLESFRTLYRELLVTAQGVSLVELCRAILDRTGAWPEVESLPDSARLSARLNLYRFLDLAEEWSPLDGSPSLPAFLDHLDLLADEGAASELDTARVSGEDAVALLTVHRAKGLEWDVVFLPALADQLFPSRVITFEDPYSVAWVLPHDVRLDREWLPPLSPDDQDARREVLRAVHAEQEWRTAYVAVTRARHRLVGSGSYWTGGAKPRTQSPLFDIIDALADRAPGRCDEAGDPPESTRVVRSEAPDPLFPDGWRSAMTASLDNPLHAAGLAARKRLAGAYDREVAQLQLELGSLPEPRLDDPVDRPFRTSVTGLVTLASCPLRYRWSEIERLPRRPSAAARYGVDLHRRIELHNRGSLALDDADAGFYDAIGTESGSDDERGVSAFAAFEASRFAQQRPALIEAPFDLAIGDARISGRIDAVYDHGRRPEVVDFKSGRASTDPARRVQLEAYAIAIDEADLGLRLGDDGFDVTFAYFGGGDVEEVSEHVDDVWLEAARTHVTQLVDLAQADEHAPTPSAACRACDFLHLCQAGQAWIETQR